MNKNDSDGSAVSVKNTYIDLCIKLNCRKYFMDQQDATARVSDYFIIPFCHVWARLRHLIVILIQCPMPIPIPMTIRICLFVYLNCDSYCIISPVCLRPAEVTQSHVVSRSVTMFKLGSDFTEIPVLFKKVDWIIYRISSFTKM